MFGSVYGRGRFGGIGGIGGLGGAYPRGYLGAGIGYPYFGGIAYSPWGYGFPGYGCYGYPGYGYGGYCGTPYLAAG